MFFDILVRLLRSYVKTEVTIKLFAKKYAHRFILRSVRLKMAENKSVRVSKGSKGLRI